MTEIKLTKTKPAPKPKPVLVFVCSGSADVGELTDRPARRCWPGRTWPPGRPGAVCVRRDGIMFNADLAERVLLMDGCPNACARRTFEHAGLHRYVHFDLSAAGLGKGQSPVIPENVQRVVEKAVETLKTANAAAGRIPASTTKACSLPSGTRQPERK